MTRFLACTLVLGSVLLGGGSSAAAENLPVTVDRYSQACASTGGGVTKSLDAGGGGKLQCDWTPREGIECQVGTFQVVYCIIHCHSDKCYAANPDKDHPVWPLNGGPNRKKVQVPVDIQKAPTLAPAN